ncbi:MAG TPA: CoA ester lyase [Nocardioides sp.]|uniref:HpcH/HpaI aldolase/citrate lyase family protein n=1 Tax=Nocardioides sp. TaxID=35761 RepID=UPI002CB3BC11|nr:CoA ester lyase [Nocardioides sp.]HTW14391.1 CoA ester lyase [Nocardioides sp.]
MSALEDALAWLYVPAPRAGELLAKAASVADGIVVDLEDAVHPRQRPAAREHLAEALPSYDGDAFVVVRVNPVSTDDFAADVAALTPLVRAGHVSAIRVAKMESAAEVASAWAAVAEWGTEPRLICQLESAGAVARAHEIASAEGVHSIMLGEADLRADLRLPRGAAGDPGLLLARQTCVLASRAAGLPSPVGSAFTDVADADGLRETSLRLAALGFVGRSCIHPRQAAVVRESFAPSPADLDWARSVLAESGAQDGDDNAASVLADGSFVDPAIVRQAERIAARVGR